MPSSCTIPFIVRRTIRVARQKLRPGGDLHPSLPPELWDYITHFLDLKDLSRLCVLNRSCYYAFLSRAYQRVRFSTSPGRLCDVKKELGLLRAVRNPFVTTRIRELYFDTEWENALIYALELERWKPYFASSWTHRILPHIGRLGKTKREVTEEALPGTMMTFSNLTDLSVCLRSMSNPLLLDILWTTCSQTLVSLSLHLGCRVITPDHTFGLGITCPHLRSMKVTVSQGLRRYSELLTELRTIVPEDGGCFEELSISLNGYHLPLIATSFGSLRKLRLDGDETTMPSILPFIACHRDTLLEITLGTIPSNQWRNLNLFNTAILTSLTLYIEPFIQVEQQDEAISFLAGCACLRTLRLLHWRHLGRRFPTKRMNFFTKLLGTLPPLLYHLTFSGLLMDTNLFLFVAQNLCHLSSLTLADFYLFDPQLEKRILQLFSGRIAVLLPSEATFTQLKECLMHYKQDTGRGELWDGDRESIERLFLTRMDSLSGCCPWHWPTLHDP